MLKGESIDTQNKAWQINAINYRTNNSLILKQTYTSLVDYDPINRN